MSQPSRTSSRGSVDDAGITFSRRELRDLAAAWLALGLAFALFEDRAFVEGLSSGTVNVDVGAFAVTFAISLLTVGIGFLLHELAHKVVAIRYGQVAAFRADYTWLFLAVMGGIIGFLFAAPGAVVHRGQLTARERGLIAAAGPVTNLALGALFGAAFFVTAATGGSGILLRLTWLGVTINFLLAGFNMLPFGPLDGRKVLDWHVAAYAALAVPSIGLGILGFLLF